MTSAPGSVVLRYGWALASTVLATGVRWLLDPVLMDQFPFVPYLLAILATAWLGGSGPAVVAAGLSGLATAGIFLPPRGSLLVEGWDQQLGLGLYLLVALGVALLGGAMHAGRRRAEQQTKAVAQEREKLRITLACIGDAVLITDARGVVVSLNGLAQELTGWRQEDAQGKPLEEIFVITNESTGQPVVNPVAQVLQSGRVVGLANHTVLIARDGTRRPIDDSAAPIRDEQTGIVGVVLVFRDVSRQRQAEQALRESEERHRLIADLTADYAATGRAEADGNVILESVTDGFVKVTGYTLPEVQEKGGWASLVHPDDHAIASKSVRRWLAGEPDSSEVRMITREGDIRWLRYLGRTRSDPAGGSRPRLILAAQDVTERQRHLSALEERVRLAAFGKGVALALNQSDSLPDMLRHCAEALVLHLQAAFARIWTLDEVHNVLVLRASAGLYTHLDGPHGRVPVGQFKIGRIAQERRPHLSNAVVGDPRVSDQEWARREKMVAFAGYPLLVEDRLVGVMALFAQQPLSDVTLEAMGSVANSIALGIERKGVENRLRDQREWLEVTLASIGDGVIATDTLGRVTFLNPEAQRLTGWSLSEAEGRPLDEIFHILHEQTRQPVENPVARVLREGVVVGLANHTVLISRDGTEWPIDDSAAPIRNVTQTIQGVVLVFRDVTEQRRNEAILAGQKRVFELLVHGAPLPEVLDALCAIIEGQTANRSIATVLLVDEDGRRLRSVAGNRAPVAYARAVDGVAIGPEVGSCGTAAYRAEPVVVADIATDPLWANFRDLALGHGFRACWSTPILSSRDRVLGTFAVYHLTPHHPTEEEVRLVNILARTASVAIERRQAEAALRESDRRKDEFLATLAHELRNPLAPMRTALQIMQLAGDDPGSVGQAREMMERQMRHLVRLVDDLLDVSRITRGKLELRRQRIDLATVLRTAIETARPLLEAAQHQLSVTLPEPPIFVDGDPVRLAQIFANLLNNAAKYTERGGSIRLAAERIGSDAVISVRDTGLGIPRDMLGKIFELFTQVDHTLEKAQGGLGIGLTLVRRLTEMHGGTVEARSEGSGRGSEFLVRLPAIVSAEEATGRPADLAEEGSPAPKHRILVVDDNRDAALSLGMMLRLMGSEVRTAHDGLEAVKATEVFHPEVVLLDIGLPKLNGYEVARRIREQTGGRDVVLIAVTGWGQEEDRRRAREAGFNHHLVKPVDPPALEKLLAGLLNPG